MSMTNGIKVNNLRINLISFIVVIIYIAGFFLNEDGSGSGEYDYINYLLVTQENLTKDFLNTLLNKGFSGYTPLHFIIYKPMYFLFGVEALRLINFLISFFIILIFYKLLRIRFTQIENNQIILIALLPTLDPYFRSSAYWFQNEITGLILFLFSLYFFIKFDSENQNKIDKNLFYSIFFCGLAFYTKQNYIFFVIFYYFYYIFSIKTFKFFLVISLYNLLIFLPFLYILFKFNSFAPGAANQVFSISINNILIFFSFFAFYFLPFHIFKINKYFFHQNKIKILLSFFIIVFLSYFFNYDNNLGGGVFYKISQILFKNNSLLFISSFVGLIIFFDVFDTKKITNKFIFIPFLTIIIFLKVPYQEYFAIYFFYIYFLILEKNSIFDFSNSFNKKLSLIYCYFAIFLIGSIIYNLANLKELI